MDREIMDEMETRKVDRLIEAMKKLSEEDSRGAHVPTPTEEFIRDTEPEWYRDPAEGLIFESTDRKPEY